MMASKIAALCSQPLVACNVYVSAGRPRHKDLLITLLKQAQRKCELLRKKSGGHIGIIHAFADGPYDRSSFHLAGNADHVATVASKLAVEAVTGLSVSEAFNEERVADGSRHPYVGIVDHVAVMPLVCGGARDNKFHRDVPEGVIAECGGAARCIGSALKDVGVKVYLYGNADEKCTPLATVRREKTTFFKSGGLNNVKDEEPKLKGIATVGAPSTFVENWNIRLTSNCTTKMARSLTRALRERDGGLVGVEALTLPYSKSRHEIACNLTQPYAGSVKAIQNRVDKWVSSILSETPVFDNKNQWIEKSYRVGTTAEQCFDVMSRPEEQGMFDKEVMERFKRYLSGD